MALVSDNLMMNLALSEQALSVANAKPKGLILRPVAVLQDFKRLVRSAIGKLDCSRTGSIPARPLFLSLERRMKMNETGCNTEALTEALSVPKQCESLDKTVENLASIVNNLQSRLNPVLKPEPNEKSEPKCTGNVNCPLANQICGINLRIEQQIENIDKIIARLEI